MNTKQLRRSRVGLCALVLAIAALLRLAGGTKVQALVTKAAESPAVVTTLLQAGLGDAVIVESAEPEEAQPASRPRPVQTDPALTASVPDEPVPEPLVFTQEDAEALAIAGTGETPSAGELLARPLQLDFSLEGPKVLIIHTHATEAYTPEPGWEYEPSDTLRTTEPDCNIIRVGTELAEALSKRGVGVVHDTTVRDLPTYNGSYTRTLAAIEDYLAEYPSIRIVIDLHRDAADNPDGSPVAVTTTVAQEEAAQLMFVVGTDRGGLSHPNWQENLALAAKLQALLNRTSPGLCRAIDLRTERFNQHASFGSLLVEVGAAGNTLAQALRSVPPLADAVCAIIEDTKTATDAGASVAVMN